MANETRQPASGNMERALPAKAITMNKLAIEKELEKVEKELDKCRTSTFADGWQTSRFAKKSRKWDYYAQRKRELQDMLADLEETAIV